MILSVCVEPDTLMRFPELSGEILFLSKTIGLYSTDKGDDAALQRVESRLFYNKLLKVDVVNKYHEPLYERPIPNSEEIHLVIRSKEFFVN